MVKLTFENVSVKLGKPVDPRTLTAIELPGTQITELGSFEKFGVLERVDLSSNRLCFPRQITGLFAAKSTLINVNLSENPVCASANYRLFMIHNLPNCEVLDGQDVTDEERQMAEKVIGKGEKIETAVSRDGEEEEAEEIARLNEEAARTRIDPELRKKEMMRQQQEHFEAERAEAERIAALLGEPLGATPIQDQLDEKAQKEAEKKAKAEKEARERAEKKELKEQKEQKEKEAKAAATRAKEEEKAQKKAAQAQQEAEEARKRAEREAEKEAAKTKAAGAAAAASAQQTSSTAPAQTNLPEKTATQEDSGEKRAEEKTEERERANLTFKDTRSGLQISTALSDAERSVRSESIAPVLAVPKRKTATEESIFGSDAEHRPLDLTALPTATGPKAKASLFGDDDDDDFFKKASNSFEKKTAPKTSSAAAAPKSKLIFDDDDDDLGMFSSAKKTATASTAAKSTTSAAPKSDDLFAMLETSKPAKSTNAAPKKTSVLDSGNFDVDSFISSTKTSGGLFDD